jgi:hypothetical protein
MHDDKKPEDVDTNLEDHAADEWRYACMSRPWARPIPVSRRPELLVQKPTLGELTQKHIETISDRRSGRI